MEKRSRNTLIIIIIIIIICSDKCACSHTETEDADRTCYLTQLQYTETASPNADHFIIMIVMAFKGANRYLLIAPQTVSNTYAQVTQAQSCANHMQHIERLSRATRRVACHVVRRDSSAIKVEKV